MQVLKKYVISWRDKNNRLKFKYVEAPTTSIAFTSFKAEHPFAVIENIFISIGS